MNATEEQLQAQYKVMQDRIDKLENKLNSIKHILSNSCIDIPTELCLEYFCDECGRFTPTETIEKIKEIIGE